MGHDKYGLDWSVWGDAAKKPEPRGSNPSDTIGKGWGGSPKNTTEDDSDNEPDQTSQPKQLTCTLRNARFIPDETTDFNKPCKITVDVEGIPKGAISFALWAKYKDEDYDLQQVQTAIVENGKAQTELKLFYVDQYYDDVSYNKEKDATVEYYTKVSNKAAREIESEFLKMPLSNDEQTVAVKLFEYRSVNDITALSPSRDKVTLVDNKWVYIFSTGAGPASLIYECQPAANGMNQTFESVSWNDAELETNKKTWPRQTTGGVKEKLELQCDKDYYILLSEMQLTSERLDFYTNNIDALKKRATSVAATTLKTGTEPVNVYLVDYIGGAYYLRNEYDKCIQEHEDYISDKDRAQRVYLAGLVCEVARAKPRLKGWLDYGAVVKERDGHDREVKRRLQEKEKAERNLSDWKQTAGYMLTRDDYNGVKEIEEQILGHEAALTTLDEIKYLEGEGEDKKSWLNEIFKPEGRFIFFRKLETLSSLDNFWDLFGKYIVAKYLANFGPTKMKGVLTVEVQTMRIEHFLDEVHETIGRAKLKFPDLVENKGRWFFMTIDQETKIPFIDYHFKESGQASGISHLDTKNYKPIKRKWNALRKNIDNTLPGLQKVLVAIEAVNLGNALKQAFQTVQTGKDRFFNTVNLAGSATDFLATFEHIGGKQKVTKYYSQYGKTYKNATLIAERSFAIINLTGAICDYIGALKGTAEASAEGKNGIAAGWAVIGLASIASGTSAAMTIGATSAQLAGASVNAAFVSAFGLSSTALGVIGIGLFVVGGGILWLFEDSDFHEWAKRCSWTKEQQKPEPVQRQIQTLHNLICEFTADSYLYENRMAGTEVFSSTGSVYHQLEYLFTLRVRPGYYAEEKSRYNIKLKIIREGGLFGKDTTVLDREIILAGSSACQISNLRGDEIHTLLLHRFTGKELGLSGDYHNDTFKYALTGNLDFYGDGTQVLFDVRKEGTLKMQGRDA